MNRFLLASSLTPLIFLAACSSGMSSHQAGSGRGAGPEATAIKHVVVIFGENVSFDHYFATYPVAANPSGEPAFTAAAGTPTPMGLSGTLITANPNASNTKNGSGATNPFRLDRAQAATADQDHEYTPEQTAFDNGAMDLFPYAVGKADPAALALSTSAPRVAATKGLTMGYFDGNTVTAMWNYAQHYSLSDHFFGTTFGPS
ncbi:MAG: alkaline phosphatase family protein [Acidobacteriaceae bacterium]